MKDVKVILFNVATGCLALVLIFVNLECTLPTYDSPSPGVIEVRLHTISQKIPFLPLNNFTLKVTSVQAVLSDGARLTIYQDVKAIDRAPSNYNTLDSLAYFSKRVLGSAFAPPGNYSGVSLIVEPGPQVIEDGYRTIPVTKPPEFIDLTTSARQYAVNSGDTVRIYLTINLDSALVKRADDFLFQQKYLYISSIH